MGVGRKKGKKVKKKVSIAQGVEISDKPNEHVNLSFPYDYS